MVTGDRNKGIQEDDTEGLRVIIAGGGTGGHVYPGIAIAKEILRRKPCAHLLFVGTARGLENKIVPQEGFRLEKITVAGLKGISGTRLLESLLKIPASLWQSYRIIAQFKPQIIIGVGGYSSGPPVLMGALLRIPILLLEQNAIPGLTNRLLARFANKIATSFSESQYYFGKKAELTGNPVRREFGEIRTDTAEERFVVFVIGGSQGARAINKAMILCLDYLKPLFSRLKLIHQTGPQDYEEVLRAYQKYDVEHEVRPFYSDMPVQYARSNLLISRAGAITLAEIGISGRASILIPFPSATDNHQQKNAESLAQAGAAEVILQQDLTGELLASRIRFYLDHPEVIRQMMEISHGFGRPDAVGRIVDMAEDLAKSPKSR